MHIGSLYAVDPEANILEVIPIALNNITAQPLSCFPLTSESFTWMGYMFVLFLFFGVIAFAEWEKNRQTVPGREHGGAKWNKNLRAYNKQFTEPLGKASNKGEYNMIFTNNVKLSMNAKKTFRNNNVFVIGGSGSGKTRFFAKPNLLQANCNYVVTDPKGEISAALGGFFERQGYEVKVFNLIEKNKSCRYNPFEYIRENEEADVLTMIDCLIQNTSPSGKKGEGDFWEKSETALLQALCFYLVKYRPKEERNFSTVMELIRCAEVDENNPNKKSKLDKIFDSIENINPECISVKQYKAFKIGAGKTLKSILISVSVRLAAFNLREIGHLTNEDDIGLDDLGTDKPVILFVIIPTAESTYNFLVSMLYSQLFQRLYFKCESGEHGFTPCPRHIRFILDEFVNIGQIPEFTKKLATMRGYEISCSIIVQNLSQIKALYKDDWETLIGNCDSLLFLGGQEQSSLEYLSKDLGEATIVQRNYSFSKGMKGNSSFSQNKTGRKLMFENEIMTMPKDCCILIINGLDPFYGKKYKIEKHPNYKLSGDYDKSLLYVNPYDNSKYGFDKQYERLEANFEEQKNEIYKKAQNSLNTGVKLYTGVKSVDGLIKSLNLTSVDNLRERFIPSSIAPPAIEQTTKDLDRVREFLEETEDFIENSEEIDVSINYDIEDSFNFQSSDDLSDADLDVIGF